MLEKPDERLRPRRRRPTLLAVLQESSECANIVERMIFFYDDKRNALVCALDGGTMMSVTAIRMLGYRLDDVALFRLPKLNDRMKMAALDAMKNGGPVSSLMRLDNSMVALRNASRAAARSR